MFLKRNGFNTVESKFLGAPPRAIELLVVNTHLTCVEVKR